ncbi:hypothetical protein E1A91_D09G049300v1 [Gossypium mustelinum]|uniref:Uncharacterized protein n=1 Tax=Gossypium mustelinum TaxID=34275 RepID=A0A5D2TI67_GOSMU|nr:hypothetical protein E1A91_D09G049300v1 [Gossypium mustelinum]
MCPTHENWWQIVCDVGAIWSTTRACIQDSWSTRPCATVTLEYFHYHIATTSYTASHTSTFLSLGIFVTDHTASESYTATYLNITRFQPFHTSWPRDRVTTVLQFCLDFCEMFQFIPCIIPNLFWSFRRLN